MSTVSSTPAAVASSRKKSNPSIRNAAGLVDSNPADTRAAVHCPETRCGRRADRIVAARRCARAPTPCDRTPRRDPARRASVPGASPVGRRVHPCPPRPSWPVSMTIRRRPPPSRHRELRPDRDIGFGPGEIRNRHGRLHGCHHGQAHLARQITCKGIAEEGSPHSVSSARLAAIHRDVSPTGVIAMSSRPRRSVTSSAWRRAPRSRSRPPCE